MLISKLYSDLPLELIWKHTFPQVDCRSESSTALDWIRNVIKKRTFYQMTVTLPRMQLPCTLMNTSASYLPVNPWNRNGVQLQTLPPLVSPAVLLVPVSASTPWVSLTERVLSLLIASLCFNTWAGHGSFQTASSLMTLRLQWCLGNSSP